MEERSTKVDWSRWKREGLVIMATGASLTLSLWLKRMIEKLIESKIVDKTVVDRGIGGLPATTSPYTNKPTWFSQSNIPDRVMEQRNGNWLPRRAAHGPGRRMVTVDGQDILIYYEKAMENEGQILYMHDEQLRADHITSCPLLLVRTSCENCNHYLNDGIYWRNPVCLAREKIEHHAEDGVGMSSLRSMFVNSSHE